MTEAKRELLRSQGLLTHVPSAPRLISFDQKACDEHWRSMVTANTPPYYIQRRLARTDHMSITERVVRWIRRIRG